MTRSAPLTAAIATLDRPQALARCLDALLAGEVLPSEVIVVDQSGGDETRSVVEQRQGCPLPIIYVHQRRRGLSASRNAAVMRATRPIIAVTDDDCVPAGRWVAAIEQAFASPSAPEAVTGRVLPLGPEMPGLYAVSSRTSMIPAEFSGKVAPWLVGTGGNFSIKRAWLERIGGYDERLGAGSPGRAGEDMDLIYRLLGAGARVRYDPAVLVYHERQSKARRRASRSSYGHGIGACCGLWLRHRDPQALQVLGRWLFNHAYAMAGALRRRQLPSACEEAMMLQGTVQGLIYGLHVRDGG